MKPNHSVALKPKDSLLQPHGSPTHRACAIAAALLHGRHNPHPSSWLTDACHKMLAMRDEPLLVQALIVEPSTNTAECPTGWRTLHAALAGAPTRDCAEALLHESRAHRPNDDAALRPALREPACWTRRSTVADNGWPTSRLYAFRAPHGLSEYAAAFLPYQAAEGARAVFLECCGLTPGWEPEDALLDLFAATASLLSTEFKRRFVRRQLIQKMLLDRLSHTQRQIAPLLAEGLAKAEIAKRVGRSPHTIHDHAKAVYKAWDVRSRHELQTLWATGESLPTGLLPTR